MILNNLHICDSPPPPQYEIKSIEWRRKDLSYICSQYPMNRKVMRTTVGAFAGGGILTHPEETWTGIRAIRSYSQYHLYINK